MMSKIEELIQKLCPNSVEFKKLKDIGSFFGGLSGKSKADFIDGNAKFITYMNVYSNPSINLKIEDMVRVDEDEKQNTIAYGDILFTVSSETLDECGMSSVVTEHPKDKFYLNSFCFGFRMDDLSLYNINFLKHLFRSTLMRKVICKCASGVTRFNLSKKKMAEIEIPLPPLEVQKEIVRILDTFTALSEKLNQELELRKKQYEYYREKILSFEGKDVEWKPMGEVGTFIRGNGLQKSDFIESGVGCIHYGQIYTYYGTATDQTKSFISHSLSEKLKRTHFGDLILTTTSENVEDVCKAVAWLGQDDICIGGHSCLFRHKQNPKFIAYFTQTYRFLTYKQQNAVGVKVIDISCKKLETFLIPIPSLAEQDRIVSILDKFDTLVNDQEKGLPAEIRKVQKQYEYYREKLLTF